MISGLASLLRNKTFRRFFISFILVFLIPSVVLLFQLNSIALRMREDARNKEYLIGEQLKSSIDSQIYALMVSAGNLSWQKKIIDYAQDTLDGGEAITDQRFRILIDLSEEIAGIGAVDNYLLSGYIYNPENNRIFSTMGIVDSESYYRVRYRAMSYYPEYKSRLDSRQDSRLFAVGPPAYLTDESNISYSTEFWYGQDHTITLVLNMNTALLRSQVKPIAEHGSNVAIIHTAAREIIYADSPLFAELLSVGELLDDAEGWRQVNVSGARMILSCHRSVQTGCAYYIMTPTDEFYRQSDHTRNLLLMMYAIMLVFGACIIIMLSRMVYRPIGDLRVGLTGVYEDEYDDDFAYIRGAISRINSDKSKIEHQLYRQSNRMRDLLISRLMYSRYRSEESMREDLKNVEIEFNSDLFAVLLVWSDAFLDSDNEDEVYIQQFAISNIFAEILNDRCATYPVILENKTGFLVNFPDSLPEEELYEDVKQRIKKAISIYTEHFNKKIYASFSRVYNGFYGVRRACSEAENLSETVDKDNELVCAEPESGEQALMLFGLTDEAYSKLENLLLLGDGAAAAEFISDELAAIPKSLPGWKKRLIRSNICICMLRMLTPVNFNIDRLSEFDRDLGTPLDKEYLSTEDLRDVAVKIAAFSKYPSQKAKDGAVEQRTEKYIADHFTDPTLSASSIADFLGLHVNYLSSLYKKRTGESLLQLIGVYRVNHAKMLLSTTAKKIEDIAEESGFYNSSSFIRTFKRYEGITPGLYRTIHNRTDIDT